MHIFLQSLSHQHEPYFEYNYDDIYAPIRNGLSADGKLYAVPFYAESSFTFYRKDLFEKADHLLVWLAAFSYLEDSTRTGVHLYRYEDGFLHEKAMLIDDRVACVGTANFDNRSFRLNFEITAIIHDEKFAADVKAMFERDFEKSRRMEESEYEKKPFWFRFAVRLARLTSPVQ